MLSFQYKICRGGASWWFCSGQVCWGQPDAYKDRWPSRRLGFIYFYFSFLELIIVDWSLNRKYDWPYLLHLWLCIYWVNCTIGWHLCAVLYLDERERPIKRSFCSMHIFTALSPLFNKERCKISIGKNQIICLLAGKWFMKNSTIYKSKSGSNRQIMIFETSKGDHSANSVPTTKKKVFPNCCFYIR